MKKYLILFVILSFLFVNCDVFGLNSHNEKELDEIKYLYGERSLNYYKENGSGKKIEKNIEKVKKSKSKFNCFCKKKIVKKIKKKKKIIKRKKKIIPKNVIIKKIYVYRDVYKKEEAPIEKEPEEVIIKCE